jgi:hypothetical protein
MAHLWEVEHDYCGPESNWFATGIQQRDYSQTWDSWSDFAEGWGSPIDGLNWLYRFDWIKTSPEDIAMFPDEDNRDYLRLFYLLPRKGILLDHTIYVTEDDEPAVRAYLEPAALYTSAMWSPLLRTGLTA